MFMQTDNELKMRQAARAIAQKFADSKGDGKNIEVHERRAMPEEFPIPVGYKFILCMTIEMTPGEFVKRNLYLRPDKTHWFQSLETV